MAKISILFGIILLLVGIAGYIATDETGDITLIPAILGLALVLLGIVGLKEKNLKKSMRAASLLALLGFLGAGIRLLSAFTSDIHVNPIELTSQIIITILCAVFIGVAVKSFVKSFRIKQN
ncbi:MAG TPA: hypothetical protein ENI76_02230 [Ignavibacteria bacterium]|nr:hypothetical protein [Ignavibacteria bacterium]